MEVKEDRFIRQTIW